jgi:ATP-dependent DNA helicase RecQ
MSIDGALERFGLSGFRPGQRDVIEAVMAGRPTIAVLPTGAGKSLCYQLPAVALGKLAVVVSPLISLMKDQVDALTARGIAATFINSSVDPGERESRLRAAVRGELQLLYVAPERFRVPGFAAQLAKAQPGLFAVDEAHCISEWGHDFRPDYARLGDAVAQLKPPRLLALTATATPDVREQIGTQLGMRDPAIFVRGFDRPNLAFSVVQAGGDADKLRWCMGLLAEVGESPALVYAATRKNAERAAEGMRARGLRAAAYHAGLGDEERARVQEQFMAGELRVVVATNAFGMGVDKRDVRLVVHHDLPGSAEAYWQEAGRAGRDGEPARCVLLFNHGDVRLREFLIASAGDNGPKPEVLQAAERERLRAMVGYAYARGCRRNYLLGYFGDPDAGSGCSGCDLCELRLGPPAPVDDEAHLVVRKVLSTVARVDGWFGRNRIALALEGSEAKEVTAARLDQLGTYGVLRGRSHAWVLDLLGGLEAAGLLASTRDEYPRLAITPSGREVMHDRKRSPVALPPEPRARSRGSGSSRSIVAPRSAEAPRLAARSRIEIDADDPTFQRLRELRAKLAQAAKLPAYCVFHDRTLAEIARVQPRSLDELAQISGVGPNKLEKYGEQLLAELSRS